jgi:hypothetical protein
MMWVSIFRSNAVSHVAYEVCSVLTVVYTVVIGLISDMDTERTIRGGNTRSVLED